MDIKSTLPQKPIAKSPPNLEPLDELMIGIMGTAPERNGRVSFEYVLLFTPYESMLTAGDGSIVKTYRRLLASDPDLTMPVAAIEALVLLLTHSQVSTISETLDLLATSTTHLKRSIPNPISLSAGTDLFQRYLITTLQRPGQLGPAGDFRSIRSHLLSNGRLFVQRAKESRQKIASFGRHFVRDGATVLTNGGSRVVGALLRSAADSSSGSVRFRVVYVLNSAPPNSDSPGSEAEPEGHSIVRDLRSRNVPVATIPESAVAYSLGKVDMVIVGAEGVVENGGIISRLGTYQIGLLAKAAGKPFYVVAESHKFVRLYPLSQYDLPIEQKVIEFSTAIDEDEKQHQHPRESQDAAVPQLKHDSSQDSTSSTSTAETPFIALDEKHSYFDQDSNTKTTQRKHKPSTADKRDAVDFTPPNLISALITESGVLTPSAVSEELIKIWF
ncbi:translation initiation factor eIF-2B subunit alpha [Acarospora aff. strigata]|nr:translation initiation factor eIF-2B subunit alpha [Acarospora aff. strigata]